MWQHVTRKNYGLSWENEHAQEITKNIIITSYKFLFSSHATIKSPKAILWPVLRNLENLILSNIKFGVTAQKFSIDGFR